MTKALTRKKAFIIFILLLAFIALGCKKKPQGPEKAKAQEKEKVVTPKGPVEAEAIVDKSTASLGEVITYTLTVEAVPEITPKIPEVGSQITGLRIIDIGGEGPKKAEGRKVWKKWYKLQGDLVGSYIIPPVHVPYIDPNGKEAEATAPQIFIEIQSVLKEGEEVGDIRDIKPLEKIENPLLYIYLMVSIGLIILTGVGIGLWLFFRKRKRGNPEVIIPPDEVALKALEELHTADYLEEEDYRSFYFILSEVFRAYMEARYKFPAQESTSEELIPQIEHLDLTRSQKDMVRKLVRWEDLVKFAQHLPTQERSRQDLEETRQIILDTREKHQEIGEGVNNA